MKRSLFFLSLVIGLLSTATAQVCTPDSAHFTAGVVAYPATLPCITQQAAFAGTVSVRIPDSIDAQIAFPALPPHTYYLHIDSVQVDSITGAPAGISSALNPGRGVWLHGGQYSCVQFTGTTAAAVGSYPLSILGAGCVHGSIAGFPVDSCHQGHIPNFLNYSLSVCAAPVICTPDSAHFTAGVTVYPSTLPCITPGTAYTGTVSFKVPDSIDAHYVNPAIPANRYFLHVDSMTFDQITGFPAGVSAAVNPGYGKWLYGSNYGCTVFSGTTTAVAGSYPLTITGRACGHATFATAGYLDTCLSFNFASIFPYTVDVCQPVVHTVCTPDSTHFTNGVLIYPASLPCINQGAAYSGTVSIKIPDSIDAHIFVSALPANTYYLHVDSMRFDSIAGIPSGITASTNPGDSVWIHGGHYGCALFAGTSHAPTGNYPLSLYGRGCVHGNILGFPIDSCVSGNLAAYFTYSLNVCSSTGGSCTVDTTHFTSTTHVYPATLPCIVTGTAFSGQINIQVPQTVDAHDFIQLIPAGTAVITVDSIDINSITGLPAGISSISTPVLNSWLTPLSYACAHLSGTVNAAVTPAGNYPLTISGIGCGHGTFPLIGYKDTCMPVTFSRVFPYRVSVCYPAGVTEITEGVDFAIYPNPNQGTFTVSLSSADRINGQMAVLDQLGRTIHIQDIDVTGTSHIAMDLGHIAPGVYILAIHSANGRMVKQFVVK